MKIYKFYVLVLIMFFAGSVYTQVAVIANKSVPENSITSSKLEDIYTLRAKTWSDGKAIVPFTIKSETEIVDKFFSAIGKSNSEIKKIWMKIQLTGEGQAPEGLGSEDDVLNKVASTPGAIGFVDAKKVNGNVKVLLEIK